MSSTLITNARMVNEGRTFDGDLRIENGRIAQIGNGLAPRDGEQVVDAAGRWLLPGMIDDRALPRTGPDPQGRHRQRIGGRRGRWPDQLHGHAQHQPADAGFNHPEAKYELARGRAWANYGFYHGASNDNLDAIRAMDPKKAPGVKVFMGASTGNMLVDNPETLDAIFRECPTPIITHCEDTPMIDANLKAFRKSTVMR